MSGGGRLCWCRGGLGRLFEALNNALCRSVRHIAADDLIFADEQGGVHRLGGTGIVVDLVDVAHGIFAGQPAQVIPLAFLKPIVPVKDFACLLRNSDLAGLGGRIGDIPAKILQKFYQLRMEKL